AAHLDHRSAGIPIPSDSSSSAPGSSSRDVELPEDDFVEFDEIDDDDAGVPQPLAVAPPVVPHVPPKPAPPAPPRVPAVEEPPASGIERALRSVKDLQGIAVCDHQGWVEGVAGQVDAETVCAVVTMSTPQIRRIAALMGMGDVRQWAIGGKEGTVYTV